MIKEFKNIEEFINVISKIPNDERINLTGDNDDLPEERQFPYVKIASNFTLEKAIENLPTNLRYELIMLGYDSLLDELKWDELDINEEFTSGKMNSNLIVKFPHLVDKANWSKLKSNVLTRVLIAHPQFANRVDFSLIKPENFSFLLRERPEFADKFDFNSLNNANEKHNWFGLLKAQPQFASKCDWSFIHINKKKELIEIYPQFSEFYTVD
jgi:hypothetical protein